MLESGWASDLFAQFGLLGIFAATALEYACLPMPSEVLLPLAGYIAASSGIPLALTVSVTVFAGVAGSALCYALGALGGRPLLERLFSRFPPALRQLQRTEEWHKGAGGLSVMLARVIPLFRTWISFVAGICRQPFWFFMLYSCMGIIIWNTVLIWGGYAMYSAGRAMPGYIRFLPAVGWLLLLSVLWLQRRRAAKRAEKP
ncbi:MAG TPA: DedA family protein [Candidatus Aphodomonas merdavium]|nr:DedA family protein [Candidatus Aphodomonas merdavium]